MTQNIIETLEVRHLQLQTNTYFQNSFTKTIVLMSLLMYIAILISFFKDYSSYIILIGTTIYFICIVAFGYLYYKGSNHQKKFLDKLNHDIDSLKALSIENQNNQLNLTT